ncbi:hypothetical protein F9C11_21535 [Amycolatopsis sp. VS8301801F10]|uniref:hypothetical protein n=1 Tax=Amycolatopsis sp. VS8301801F10 TaxID=2652442 RepID=UPI0038FCA705
MPWLKKIREASMWIDEISDLEAPRPEKKPKKPAKPKQDNKESGKGGTSGKLQALGERIGFAGIVAVTAVAAVVGLVGCKPVAGSPSPRAPYQEDADARDYQCQYDGNQRCPGDGAVQR